MTIQCLLSIHNYIHNQKRNYLVLKHNYLLGSASPATTDCLLQSNSLTDFSTERSAELFVFLSCHCQLSFELVYVLIILFNISVQAGNSRRIIFCSGQFCTILRVSVVHLSCVHLAGGCFCGL